MTSLSWITFNAADIEFGRKSIPLTATEDKREPSAIIPDGFSRREDEDCQEESKGGFFKLASSEEISSSWKEEAQSSGICEGPR